MKVLVIGEGGREHALVWKIAQSPKVDKIYCAPGNAGIAALATCLDISSSDINRLSTFAKEHGIDLTVVGPEAPLAEGIVDEFQNQGLRIFGPDKKCAMIESSKVFAKNLMKKYKIPTAEFEVFDDADRAIDYIKRVGAPIVVKAEGLAAGKGVVVAKDIPTAIDAVRSMIQYKNFGEAGSRVVIEEFLEGQEVTVLSFCDGKTFVPMVSSRDHKRVFDNDEGPNTGGMGAISPAPFYSEELSQVVENSIIGNTIEALKKEGLIYKGVLYTGLILTKNGPKVLEFNCRFGDPETQVVLPRLETDLVEIMEAVIDGNLSNIKIEWKDDKALCVVACSGGYPQNYQKGKVISGLDEAERMGVVIFHAGTSFKDGKLVTSGGRVLGVTALGADLEEVRNKAYAAISKINFEGMHFRRDIGYFK